MPLIITSWLIALIGTLGSLYFSEVIGFAPCLLCWYQRIALYPLVILLPLGIIKKDNAIVYYTLPFSLIGIGLALWQNLLVWQIIPTSICAATASCAAGYINWFGFITIPFLSLLAFSLITICLLLSRRPK